MRPDAGYLVSTLRMSPSFVTSIVTRAAFALALSSEEAFETFSASILTWAWSQPRMSIEPERLPMMTRPSLARLSVLENGSTYFSAAQAPAKRAIEGQDSQRRGEILLFHGDPPCRLSDHIVAPFAFADGEFFLTSITLSRNSTLFLYAPRR